MKISNESNIPIFVQIANLIEEEIIKETFVANKQIISTNELSSILKVNPNTVLKGVNLLVEQKILYKKRGIGMFVSGNALSIIINKRTKEFKDNYIDTLVSEAHKINISEEELIKLIKASFRSKEEAK